VSTDSPRLQRVASMGDYVGILRRRWPYLVTIMPAILLVAVFIAYMLPASYQSSATIMLEPSSIPSELVKTTVISAADQRIELVQRTVMTPERLEPVVKKVDPYPNAIGVTDVDKARMMIGDTSLMKVDPVTLSPMVISSAFSIYYNNADPQLAKRVTEEIAQMFLTYNRETRVAAARDAYNFLKVRATQLDGHIKELEQRVSEFKTKFSDASPEARARNESFLDRAQRDIDVSESQIRIAEQQESLLKLQLSQISPNIVTAGTDAFTQLGKLRAELAEAQQKYTPDHPDIKRLRGAIERMAAEVKPGAQRVINADNPEYLRVASELDAAQRDLAALRANVSRSRMQINEYEARISKAPGVERDYAQLAREQEIAQKEFSEIQAKLRDAEIAQSLESQAMGERYTLIRKPSTPIAPSSPNRLGIILLGLVLGAGLAVGTVALRESSDPSVRSMVDVTEISSLRVIGAIPKLLTEADRRRHWLIWGSVGGTYTAAAILVAIIVFVKK
jgi:succinoglycan biosynthesis transport protein ExoP